MTTLVITAERKSQKWIVIADGASIGLRYRSWQYLALLSAMRKGGYSGGWVHRFDLEPGNDNQGRNIWRLVKEFEVAGYPIVIENDKCGCYRIALSPDQISFSDQFLDGCCDGWVRLKLKGCETRVIAQKPI
jgi:hypothetical protein